MYQVIQLSSNDDLATIRAKIETAELAHLVLIVPRDCESLTSDRALQLLRRAADDTGTQIALVAHNSFVRTHAPAFGFPVYSSMTQAQRARWRMQEPARAGLVLASQPPPSSPEAPSTATAVARLLKEWRGALLLLAAAMLLLCSAAALVVPTAQVHLVPSAVVLTTATDVIIDSSVGQVVAELRTIPARRLNRDISGTLQLRTTITKTVPDARATGTVTFTNLRAEEITLPPGVVVVTSAGVPIRFTTLTTVTVPGGVNSRVDAPIQAVDPGLTGNVRELAINTVEGSLALSLRVINTKPTVSGTLRPVKVVTANDKQKLEEQLLQQLKAQAPALLQSALKPNEFIPGDSVLVDAEDKQFDRAVDEPADVLNLKMTANAFGLAVDRQDLEALMQLLLEKEMPVGYQILPNGVKVEMVKGGKFQGIPLRQPVRAVGYATPQIDPDKVAAAVQGKSIEEARAFLASRLTLAQPPDIRVTPALIPRLPLFAFRIAVFIDEPTVSR